MPYDNPYSSKLAHISGTLFVIWIVVLVIASFAAFGFLPLLVPVGICWVITYKAIYPPGSS